MSKVEPDANSYSTRKSRRGSHKRETRDEKVLADDEFAHLTRVRSQPTLRLLHKRRMPVPTFDMLVMRETNYLRCGRFSRSDCSHILGQYLPVNGPWCVDRMASRAYVSQFSADGSLFIAGYQASRIKIFDVDHGWRLHKDILARLLRWTITDTALSPDKRFLVYASITPIVHIVNVGTASRESHANITDIHEGLNFSAHDDDEDSFGIFSVKFSSDGRELVAGGDNESIFVYDLEANKISSQILAHKNDVNTVTFADESSNIIYSGSDDSLCKVWDRRCLISNGNAAGILTGHLGGITFIDSRGDGRYFISNGKDQTIKLWDIRKMTSRPKCSKPIIPDWDYRWMQFPAEAKSLKHPFDQSLATYRGHSVLQTLIRCYFSPAHSTGQRYIYTGSHDSSVHIYDVVSGARVAQLSCHNSTVRDSCWHPYYPMLISSSWDGLIARWEFSGNEPDPSLVKNKLRRRRRTESRME